MHKCCILFLLAVSSIVNAENWPSYTLLKTTHAQFPNTRISIKKDPVYQISKQYKAFPLNSIIKKLATRYKAPISDSLIIFTAKDGYNVTMSYTDALKESGYIAFKDLDTDDNANWAQFKFGHEYTTPAPYYLLWSNPALDQWRYPSPFQLTRISLQSTESYFSAASPRSSNRQIKNGFVLFSRYCIRCHSVNHVGGNLAPELNLPKNITAFYTPKKLTDFILNAQAFNPKTKMPVFNKIISKTQAQTIQLYLKSMKVVTPKKP